jgi:hypothetical protein
MKPFVSKFPKTRNIQSGDTLEVFFFNSGFGTEEGTKRCQRFDLFLNKGETPYATICSPFGMMDTKLVAEFKNNRWQCDLD